MTTTDLQQAEAARAIAVAAASIRDIEVSAAYQVRNETRLSAALAKQHGVHFGSIEVIRPVRHYILNDVVLDTDTLILLQDGAPIPETAFWLRPGLSDRPDLAPARLVRPDGNQHVVIAHNNAHTSYGLWLAQCLPAIDWSLRGRPPGQTRLLLPPLMDWQEETLALLGYQNVPRLPWEPGRQYLLPSAEYSDYLNNSTIFHICRSRIETAGRLSASVPLTPSPHRILFVSETAPYYGRISNAEEAQDLLTRRGVLVIDAARQNVAERINLFRQADMVIGPHGNDLADVMFCKPNAILWEWMPRHPVNTWINRLARSAGLNYWGDLLDSAPQAPGQLLYDLDALTRGLDEHAARLAGGLPEPETATTTAPTADPALRQPLDRLMLGFESLGDNCEFGFVQRHYGIEPLGLLRFAGIHAPHEQRLERLTAALRCGFDGLGAPATINLFFPEHPYPREFMVHESLYDLHFHSGVSESEITPEAMPAREAKRLGFLRRKLMEDLSVGEKIWVWKSLATATKAQVQPLLDVLRELGPNILLWVAEADDDHAPGAVERLDRDLIKCYIESSDGEETVSDKRHWSWLMVCQAAYALCFPEHPEAVPQDPPMGQQLVLVEAESSGPAKPLSAVDYLARNPASAAPVVASRRNRIRSFLKWLGLE